VAHLAGWQPRWLPASNAKDAGFPFRASRARQKGKFAEGVLPAGEAPARNCRKVPQIGLMIAKTLFLT
jgi:hypothetical protein